MANNRPVSVFVGFELLSECGQQPQGVWNQTPKDPAPQTAQLACTVKEMDTMAQFAVEATAVSCERGRVAGMGGVSSTVCLSACKGGDHQTHLASKLSLED